MPWNTYSKVRNKLADQYKNQTFTEDTGLSSAQLAKIADNYLQKHASSPRILIRANLLAMILTEARIRVDSYDWFADHIDSGNILQSIQNKWRHECIKDIPQSLWHDNPAGFPVLDLSHTSPDWRNVLSYGFSGLRDRAMEAKKSAKDQEALDFFEAVTIVYSAIIEYLLRLAKEADRVGVPHVSSVLRSIATRPPQTFQEALQTAFTYNQIQEIEGEYVRSQGIFDHLFIDFYRNDLANGTLTQEQARELLFFFFEKMAALHFYAGKNFTFGGKTPDGKDTTNELTQLALEVFDARGDYDPKFTLRIHNNFPRKLLRMAADSIKAGHNAIVFANDEVAYPMFLKRGKQPEEIIDFVAIGCYEPAIMGKELCCSMTATFNLAKIAEYIMQSTVTPNSLQDIIDMAKDIINNMLTETLSIAKVWEQTWPHVNPSPVLSGTMDSCYDKGRDISNSGAKYNTSGIMCGGIGTLTDAIAAMEYLVFQRKLCSWQELRNILAQNWEGNETLRMAAKKQAPKWGNDNLADNIALQLTDFTSHLINNTPNSKGATFQMGAWSIDFSLTFGRQTKATADGRFTGDPISKNLGATIGADTNGVTALIASAAKLDHSEFPDGSVLDLMLHPSVLSGHDGAEILINLIHTYFARGGLFIHFNVVSSDMLRKAQLHPEQFSTLQVRVCGWNARFVDLSKDMQDAFIAEAEAKTR